MFVWKILRLRLEDIQKFIFASVLYKVTKLWHFKPQRKFGLCKVITSTKKVILIVVNEMFVPQSHGWGKIMEIKIVLFNVWYSKNYLQA